MTRTALLLALGLAVGVALASQAPVRAAAADEAPAYTVFHSPPARLDALLWAIVDCYPYRDLEEAKRDFLKRAEGKDVNALYAIGLWPDEKRLITLEDKFGDMPEYWQARYFYQNAQTERGDIGLLEKALELAPDDPATMYFLADARLRFVDYGLEDIEDAVERSQTKRKIVSEAAELMLRAAECEPQNTFYYYEAVMAVRQHGYDRVPEVLKRGNAAPVNEAVELFPVSYIVRSLREIRAEDDGTGRFRLLSFALMPRTMQKYIERREMMRECQIVVSLSGETDWLNLLNAYACRYGEEMYAPLHQQLTASVLAGMVFTMAAENGLIANDPQTLWSVSSMIGARGAIKGLIVARNTWRDFQYDEEHPGTASTPLAHVSLTPEGVWEEFAGAWEDQILEYLYLTRRIAGQFEMQRRYYYHPDGTITRGSAATPAELTSE